MKFIVILTNKWTGNKIVYPELFNTKFEAEHNTGMYSPVNWSSETKWIEL